MSFTVIPALRLLQGWCVSLRPGSDRVAAPAVRDPVSEARNCHREGARLILIDDLDGALAGKPRHLAMLRRIRAVVPDATLIATGGIGEIAFANAAFEAGADRVVIDSSAARQPDLVREFARLFGARAG